MDRPLAGGFLSLTGPLAPRVVVSPYRAMSFIMPPAAVTSTSSIIIILTLVHPFATSWPSSPKGDARTLRDLLSVSYGKIGMTMISHLRWLFPLWCLTAPPFPRKRGHYKAPLCCERLLKGLLCGALLSHRSAGGRWWRQPPKGAAFPTRPRRGCMVFTSSPAH